MNLVDDLHVPAHRRRQGFGHVQHALHGLPERLVVHVRIDAAVDALALVLPRERVDRVRIRQARVQIPNGRENQGSCRVAGHLVKQVALGHLQHPSLLAGLPADVAGVAIPLHHLIAPDGGQQQAADGVLLACDPDHLGHAGQGQPHQRWGGAGVNDDERTAIAHTAIPRPLGAVPAFDEAGGKRGRPRLGAARRLAEALLLHEPFQLAGKRQTTSIESTRRRDRPLGRLHRVRLKATGPAGVEIGETGLGRREALACERSPMAQGAGEILLRETAEAGPILGHHRVDRARRSRLGPGCRADGEDETRDQDAEPAERPFPPTCREVHGPLGACPSIQIWLDDGPRGVIR